MSLPQTQNPAKCILSLRTGSIALLTAYKLAPAHRHRLATNWPLGKNMTIAHSLGIGVVVGIALFFVLQRLGVLDKWLEKLDR